MVSMDDCVYLMGPELSSIVIFWVCMCWSNFCCWEAEVENCAVKGVSIKSVTCFHAFRCSWCSTNWLHALLLRGSNENTGLIHLFMSILSDIDSKLLKQHPPSEFSRPPQSISKHLNYWKASELCNWLLFYSLPLLLEHLPPLYFHRYTLFICAIHILLSDTIDTMLVDFCSLLPESYDENISTHNVHLLTHLTNMWSFVAHCGHILCLVTRVKIVECVWKMAA